MTIAVEAIRLVVDPAAAAAALSCNTHENRRDRGSPSSCRSARSTSPGLYILCKVLLETIASASALFSPVKWHTNAVWSDS